MLLRIVTKLTGMLYDRFKLIKLEDPYVCECDL